MHWNYVRFPGGKTKALTFSFDDGVEQDKPLIKLFEQYGVKGTFNLNSGMYPAEDFCFPKEEWHRRNTESVATQLYSSSSVEVASHAYTHAHIAELPISLVTAEFLKDREALERQFNCLVRGGCYPYGCVNDKVLRAADAAGLEYARCCEPSYGFDLPTNWLEWQPTCSHLYSGLPELVKRFTEESITRQPYLFYIWGHSYEFADDRAWQAMKALLQQVANRDDVWYATNGEIYEYVSAYRNLKYSADGGMVFNPSALAVQFSCDFTPVSVEPGQTIRLLG